MNKIQLNAAVPQGTKEALKEVSRATGIKIEEFVLDALKLLAGEVDSGTRTRARLFKETCRAKRLHVYDPEEEEDEGVGIAA